MKKRLLVTLLCICVILSFAAPVKHNNVEAKATKEAMKFLKGTWISVGNSQSIKVIFTRKYRKSYDLWNASYTKVDKSKKGKYMGRMKIVSTKKKGKNWYIKLKGKKGYLYYVGRKNSLTCQWRENGEWSYSFSDSLQRYK